MSEVEKVPQNAPCPCGSGKKYKRCHGRKSEEASARPKGQMFGEDPSKKPAMPDLSNLNLPGGGAGFDPSQLDPQWIAQFQQAMQRVPRGQMQKLQSVMQKAMSGQDVSKQMADIQKTLPPDVQNMLMNNPMAQAAAEQAQAPGALDALGNPLVTGAPPAEDVAESESEEMDAAQAKTVIEQAVKEGKMSEEQAAELLKAAPNAGGDSEEKKGFFKGLFGKK